MTKVLLTICIACSFPLRAGALDLHLDPKAWVQIKDKHFTVWYPIGEAEEMPRTILRRAEGDYDSIGERIGYARTHDFWTWDERVQIVYYPDQSTFAAATGQPAWSKGFSVSHLSGVHWRAIVSYKGQEGFLETILPHEIGHLILHDFLGQRRAPVWFDEGVAQLGEEHNSDEERAVVARLAAGGKTIPLAFLEGYPLGPSTNQVQVAIFYAESLYILDFLIKTYGKDAFQQLCRQLRDGRSFEEALQAAYYPTIVSMVDLQGKWKKYMEQYIH